MGVIMRNVNGIMGKFMGIVVETFTLKTIEDNWFQRYSQENCGRNIYIADKSSKFGRDVCFDLLIKKYDPT